MPVVMVSSLTVKGADTTLRALELGAVDFVTKPSLDVERGIQELARELVAKVKAAAHARIRPSRAAAQAAPAMPLSRPLAPFSSASAGSTIIAIGSSTGGTEALRDVLAPLPANSPGIVVVQHMPEHFTKQFAARLDHYCEMRVKEAENGDAIVPGQILIAPGSVFHMEVARATGNRHFAELMTYLGTMIIPRTRLKTAASAPEGRLPYLERVHHEHENILEAIRRQEPEAARAAMRTHLSNSRERLRRAQPEA